MLGIVGAVLGSQLAYVVPALLNLKLFAQVGDVRGVGVRGLVSGLVVGLVIGLVLG